MRQENTEAATKGRWMGATAFAATLLWALPPTASRAIDDPRVKDLTQVRVTTDAREVAPCKVVIEGRKRADRSLDGLRREADGAGADVVLLSELSESGIAGTFYRCGAAAAATPPFARPARPVPVATPVTPPSEPRDANSASDPPAAKTERQRRARAELESMKASVRVVHDHAEVASCEKRGEGRRDEAAGAEDAFRGEAVGANANVLLIRTGAGSGLAAEYFRCGFPERPARKR